MFWMHDSGLKENEHVGFINDCDVTYLYNYFKKIVEAVEQFRFGNDQYISINGRSVRSDTVTSDDYFKYILNNTRLSRMSVYKRNGFRIYPMMAVDTRTIRKLIDLDFSQFADILNDLRYIRSDFLPYEDHILGQVSKDYEWSGV